MSKPRSFIRQLQELEMENAQLKKDLGSLRKSVTSTGLSGAQQNLMGNSLIYSAKKFLHYLLYRLL